MGMGLKGIVTIDYVDCPDSHAWAWRRAVRNLYVMVEEITITRRVSNVRKNTGSRANCEGKSMQPQAARHTTGRSQAGGGRADRKLKTRAGKHRNGQRKLLVDVRERDCGEPDRDELQGDRADPEGDGLDNEPKKPGLSGGLERKAVEADKRVSDLSPE